MSVNYYWQQIHGRTVCNNYLKIFNSFKYMRATVTDRNEVYNEIGRLINSVNAYLIHSICFAKHWQSRNIYKTILSVVLFGYETS